MPQGIKIQLIYFLIISVIGLIITVYDKIAAKAAHRHRVPEKTLILFGFFGGALAMYITMLLIRHKTRKKKFMLSFPLFIIMHLAIFLALNFLIGKDDLAIFWDKIKFWEKK